MSDHVCLITCHDSQGEPEKLLRRCGLTVLRAESAAEWRKIAPKQDMLLIVSDLPGDAGLRELKGLRRLGVRSPAILVADPNIAFSALQLHEVGVLEVLPRPITPRTFLGWIECVCAAHLALKKRPVGEIHPLPVREPKQQKRPRAVHEILRAAG